MRSLLSWWKWRQQLYHQWDEKRPLADLMSHIFYMVMFLLLGRKTLVIVTCSFIQRWISHINTLINNTVFLDNIENVYTKCKDRVQSVLSMVLNLCPWLQCSCLSSKYTRPEENKTWWQLTVEMLCFILKFTFNSLMCPHRLFERFRWDTFVQTEKYISTSLTCVHSGSSLFLTFDFQMPRFPNKEIPESVHSSLVGTICILL